MIFGDGTGVDGSLSVMQVRKRAVRKIFGGGGSRTCTNSTVKLKSSREKGVRIFFDHDDRSSEIQKCRFRSFAAN